MPETVTDPVQQLLILRAILLFLCALGTMIYLRFRASNTYGNPVFYALGLFGLIFLVLGVGVVGYDYPIPGAILSSGFTLIAFLLGIGIGRIAFTDEPVLEIDN